MNAERARASRPKLRHASSSLELRLRIAFGLLAILSLASPASKADADTAEALFREGRQLLARGQVEAACKKLEQSARIEPSSGTWMNLAFCHAQLGKVASAWAEYLEAERGAIAQQNDARAQEARRQATALEPRLPRLTVRVVTALPGMIIRRNEQPLPISELGASTPIDPGRYTLQVSAPGHFTWAVTLDLVESGEHVVEVPPLAPDDSARVTPRVPHPSKKSAAPPVTSRRPLAARRAPAPSHVLPSTFWVTAATGAASAGVATVFGFLSLSTYDRASSRCPDPQACDETGVRLGERSYAQARVADVAWAVTALAVGVSAYLYFDSRPPSRRVTSSAAGAN